jgi:hypothetical protein
MMHRLVLRANRSWRNACSHRFNALAIARKQQTLAICFKWFDAIGVSEGRRNIVEVSLELALYISRRYTLLAHAIEYIILVTQ